MLFFRDNYDTLFKGDGRLLFINYKWPIGVKKVDHTLKVTNVLADPTRYYIYQYITNKFEEVTVLEIADEFNIHPNVARLHLTKLEDVHLLSSVNQKSGKGGRPSRLYKLSDEVIQLSFPYRDYQMLAKIAIEAMLSLGAPAKKALFETGKRFGMQVMKDHFSKEIVESKNNTFEEKSLIIRNAATLIGLRPEIQVDNEKKNIHFVINNCPFNELVKTNVTEVCGLHFEFLRGMFEILFEDVTFNEGDSMLNGCDKCTYHVTVK